MKSDRDYQINEENDTGEEHAKLVLSRLVQNPDKSVNEIIKDVVKSDLEYAEFKGFAISKRALEKHKQGIETPYRNKRRYSKSQKNCKKTRSTIWKNI